MTNERWSYGFAVMAMKDGWKRPKWVTGAYQQFEVFRLRKFAYRRKRELEEQGLIWRPWNERDNVKADTKVRWVVRKVSLETLEVID